jgi:hypothetical protein
MIFVQTCREATNASRPMCGGASQSSLSVRQNGDRAKLPEYSASAMPTARSVSKACTPAISTHTLSRVIAIGCHGCWLRSRPAVSGAAAVSFDQPPITRSMDRFPRASIRELPLLRAIISSWDKSLARDRCSFANVLTAFFPAGRSHGPLRPLAMTCARIRPSRLNVPGWSVAPDVDDRFLAPGLPSST